MKPHLIDRSRFFYWYLLKLHTLIDTNPLSESHRIFWEIYENVKKKISFLTMLKKKCGGESSGSGAKSNDPLPVSFYLLSSS